MEKTKTRQISTIGLLSALSVIMVMLRFPFAPAPFLEYDPADVPILIGTYRYGGKTGMLITIIASGIQALTVSAASGLVGFFMHVVATGSMCLVVGLIYGKKKSNIRLIVAALVGIATMTAVMALMNLVATPIFLGVGIEEVKAMLLPIIVPFNLFKSTLNSVVAMVIYKTLNVIIDR